MSLWIRIIGGKDPENDTLIIKNGGGLRNIGALIEICKLQILLNKTADSMFMGINMERLCYTKSTQDSDKICYI